MNFNRNFKRFGARLMLFWSVFNQENINLDISYEGQIDFFALKTIISKICAGSEFL